MEYLDYHMLTAVSTPERAAVVEKLAREYRLGLSRFFGEPSLSLWDIDPSRKLSTLMGAVDRMTADRPTLVVIHLGLETPEANALVDVNYPPDPYRVSRHRQAELDAVTSPAFPRAAEARGIRFVTYRDLVSREGLDSMQRPASFGYSMNESVAAE